MPKHKRRRSFLAVPFQKALFVFTRTTRKIKRFFLSKPFGSIQGVHSSYFRLLPLSDNASPLCPPLPVPVKLP
jgi:hypothetical protein